MSNEKVTYCTLSFPPIGIDGSWADATGAHVRFRVREEEIQGFRNMLKHVFTAADESLALDLQHNKQDSPKSKDPNP